MENLNKFFFPIKPSFITRIKEYEDDDKDGLNDFDLNSHGIFGQDFTQGFLAVIAHEEFINSPATLYEFLPNNLGDDSYLFDKKSKNLLRVPTIKANSLFKQWLDDRFIIRTDNVNHFNLKRCCNYFRTQVINDEDKTGIRFCEEFDLRISLFAIKGLSEDNLKDNLEPIIEKFNEDKQDDKLIFVEKKDDNKRAFVYYQCPISGFYEAIFPVFHEDRIIGCIMIGEIIYEELSVEIVTQNFKDYFKKLSISYNPVKLEKEIDMDFQCYKPFKNSKIQEYYCAKYTLKDDDDFRLSIEEHLRNIERRIRKRVGHISQRYVSTSFLKIKNSFEEEAFSKNAINKLDILSLSRIIEKALKEIVKYFPNEDGFIRIFMSDKSGNEKILKIIAVSDREELKERNIKPEDYTYDLSLIDSEIIEKNRNVSNDESDKQENISYEKLITLEKGILYQGDDLPLDHKSGGNIIRYYPTLAKNVYFIIWKRYDHDFRNNNKQFDLFKEAMFDFYRTIAANYAALWGSQVKKLQEDAIRITAHETNQVIPVIVDSLNINFKNIDRLQKSIQNGNYHHRIDDILNQLELLDLGQTIHSFAFKDIDFIKYPKMEVDIKDLINRFRHNFYKKQLYFKKLFFNLEPEKGLSVTILGNYVLIEHALNNLIDNAVKYCFEGTNIIAYLESKSNDFVIHIKSCGPKVPSKPDVFGLYSRGEEIKHIEGNGIGLFLCKKIIEAHGWKIDFTSIPIYDYDIACMASYVHKPNKYYIKDEKFLNFSKKFIGSNIEAFVSYSNITYDPFPSTFQKEYIRTTYLNDFFITIDKKYIKQKTQSIFNY